MDPPQLAELFRQVGLSALLGLLVGLQREHAASRLAGLRTFPLISVLGTACALLAPHVGGWAVLGGFLGVIALLIVGNLAKLKEGDADSGTTTEAAMLLMYAVGAYLAVGPPLVAIAVAGGAAVLLQFKLQLHGYVKRLGASDVNAIMQFVLIACIILPVLPDKAYGPYQVFNPFEVWLMVVLIVGISLSAYIAYKFLGAGVGTLLNGILGGAISSTATTVSCARRVAARPAGSGLAAVVILLATSVVYCRVLLEVQVMAPAFLPTAAPPVLVMMGLVLVPAVLLWYQQRKGQADPPEPTESAASPEQDEPADLRAAILFALLYVAVLFGLAVARQYLGQRGLFLTAALSGLTDMDAITLSASRMVARDDLPPRVGWQMIVVAAMANLVFKAGLVLALGSRRLFATVAAAFALSLGGGTMLLFTWP